MPGLRRRLQGWLPTPETLRAQRSLGFLAPVLGRPCLWQLSRRRVAAGAAIGLFFAFLIPVAQIALAAATAVFARANLPVAAAATLVTNPFTFAPIYLAAYQVGAMLLGEPSGAAAADAVARAAGEAPGLVARLAALGTPWMVGMATFAVAGAAIAWVGVHVAWIAGVRWRRWRSVRRRQAARRPR